ncbi:MAG: MASE1 domain-containing protein [Archangium sp.]
MNRPRSLFIHLAWVAVVAVIGHRLGLAFFDARTGISAVWPASGMWLAMLLGTERKWWPWVVATIAAVNLTANLILVGSPVASVAYVASNVIEMSLGAWMFERFCGPGVDFKKVRQVLVLLGVAVFANGVATIPGAWAGAQMGTAGFWSAALTWWIGDALGILVVTPLLVAWSRPSTPTHAKFRAVELTLFFVFWAAAAWLTFTSNVTSIAPYPYQLICLLVIPALRYGPGLVSLALCVLAGVAMFAAFNSETFPLGATAELFDRVMRVQLFLSFGAVTALVLAASTEERRVATANAQRTEQLLSLAMAAAGQGAWRYDVASKTLQWSGETERIFGLAPGGFDGSFETYRGFIHPHDRDLVVRTVLSALEGGRDYDIEHRIVLPSGEERTLTANGRVERDAQGKPIALIGTVSDITRRKQVDELLRQAQKMDAIGNLAGGIAHDFNNLLSVILLELGAAGPVPPDAQASLDAISETAGRAASLTRQLLAFSRRQVMQPRAVEVNEHVTSLHKMLTRIVGENVKLELLLAPQPLVAHADPGMIDQVVMNLVVNARDAMPKGGTVIIATDRVDSLDGASLTPRRSEPHVRIRVSDTGEGIPEEHRSRVFEPFFTTKAVGKGTGLGLATVFGIVRQHQGHVRFDSEVGKGTRFEIFLPLGSGAAASGSERASVSAKGGETILLVEDEPTLRRATAALLKREGFKVVEVGDGAAALKAAKEAAGAIDLLLTDVMLPGTMTGIEVAAKAGISRVIFTSGYSPELAGKEIAQSDLRWFLQKPVTPATLIETIRRCLSQRASEAG